MDVEGPFQLSESLISCLFMAMFGEIHAGQ